MRRLKALLFEELLSSLERCLVIILINDCVKRSDKQGFIRFALGSQELISVHVLILV